MPIRTIRTTCKGCGVSFEQPDDPGRKRRYHDDACKQRAYRDRKADAQAEHAAREAEDWRRTWDNIRRRASRHAPGNRAGRIRMQVEALRAKAASTAFTGEAKLCREKADELTAKYLTPQAGGTTE